MIRTSSSIAGIAAALVLVSAPGAQAAVTAKDAPSQGDIVTAFPELSAGEFSTEKIKQIGVPGKTCDATSLDKVKSGTTTTGTSATGFPVVVAGVVELSSVAKAKAYMSSYEKYVKKCASYTQPATGATVTVSAGRSLRLGDESLTVDLQTTFSSITSYSTSVLTREGKRIGNVIAVDDAAVPAASIKKLAKVAAKKMK